MKIINKEKEPLNRKIFFTRNIIVPLAGQIFLQSITNCITTFKVADETLIRDKIEHEAHGQKSYLYVGDEDEEENEFQPPPVKPTKSSIVISKMPVLTPFQCIPTTHAQFSAHHVIAPVFSEPNIDLLSITSTSDPHVSNKPSENKHHRPARSSINPIKALHLSQIQQKNLQEKLNTNMLSYR